MTPAISPDLQNEPDINTLPEDERHLVHLGLHPLQIAIAQHIADQAPPEMQPAPAIARPQSGPPPINVPAAPSDDSLPAPTTQPPTMGTMAPSAPTQRTELEAQQQNLNRGSGIAQFQHRHPVIGGIARVAAGIGSAMFPLVAAQLPGTDFHHEMLVHQNEAGIKDLDQSEQSQAQTASAPIDDAYKQAQIGKTVAETDALKNPQPADKTPEEDVYRKLSTTINPATNKPYTPLEAFHEIKATTEKVGEQEKPLGNVDQMNQALTRRFQVLNPGKPLPPEYTLPPNAKNGDYARINSSLSSEESARGTKDTHDSAAADRAESRNDRLQRQSQMDAERHQKERDTFTQPLQPAIDNAQAMKEYAESSAHTGIGDYQMMLQFQESLTAGAKAGIRFNTGEQALIQHAQNLENSIRAKWGHLTGGTSFSDDQRHEIADAMQHVAAVHQQAIARWDRQHGGGGQQATAGGAGLPAQSGPPKGATMKVPGSDGKLHWSDGKADLGVAE